MQLIDRKEINVTKIIMVGDIVMTMNTTTVAVMDTMDMVAAAVVVVMESLWAPSVL